MNPLIGMFAFDKSSLFPNRLFCVNALRRGQYAVSARVSSASPFMKPVLLQPGRFISSSASRHRGQKQAAPGSGAGSAGSAAHQQCSRPASIPHSNSPPQRAHRLACGASPDSELGLAGLGIRARVVFQCAPEKPHMPGQARAGVAYEQMQPERNSFGEGQALVHPLRDQPARFSA